MTEKIKAKIKSLRIPNIVYVLLAGLIVRLIFSAFGVLRLDQGTFIAWSRILTDGGFKNFYNSWSDYLPGYLYFLWGLGKIASILPGFPQVLLYKLPAIFTDLATGFLIYKILSRSKSERWGLVGASLFIFNPAIFANSTLWGQVDSLTSLFSLLSIYLLPFNFYLSSVSLSLGTLIKPQTAFIFPVIVFLFLKNKKSFSDFLIYCLTGLVIFAGLFLPFWNHGSFISFVIERLGVSANQYPYTSVNAFNFWGILGFWKPDNIYFQVAGYLLILGTTVYLCFKLSKTKFAEYYLLSFIFAASFIFFTRMHERHLLPVFAPLAIIAVENPILLIPYIGFSLTYVANLYYSYQWISKDYLQVFPEMVQKFFSLINVGLVAYVFYVASKNLSSTWRKIADLKNRLLENKKPEPIEFPSMSLSKRTSRLFLVAILVFAFATRVFGLNSPSTMYFDEVYHAFTAKIILSPEANKAWEWWNTPPSGFAYEWTHPPLAKLGMAAGMVIFGQNSFGWRIPGAILGTLSVLMVYLIAKEIFEDEFVGLLSATVFSLDGLALVMSRIGMNDSYILFFSLLSIYLFMKKRDFWSAFSFGLALASKWSAIWAIPILGILWLWRGKKFTRGILWFFVLPPVLYLLAYFQMFLTGHNLTTWWGMQEQIWWYHTGLKATHPYTSPWWEWPLLIRPIYLYTNSEVNGMVSRIYAFGNPFVFWFGFISVIFSLIYAFLEKNKKLWLIIFSYLVFFTPWAASPRIMFLYHYLPSIPFLAIATAYVLRRNPKFITYYLLLITVAFIYFYPHWAGLQIPLWLDKSYYWFSSWR